MFVSSTSLLCGDCGAAFEAFGSTEEVGSNVCGYCGAGLIELPIPAQLQSDEGLVVISGPWFNPNQSGRREQAP